MGGGGSHANQACSYFVSSWLKWWWSTLAARLIGNFVLTIVNNRVPLSLLYFKEDPVYFFPEKKLHSLVPIFTFMYLWAISIFPRLVHIFCCRPIVGRCKCRNWERGCKVSFLEIFVSNFRYSVFAVWKDSHLTRFPRSGVTSHQPTSVLHPKPSTLEQYHMNIEEHISGGQSYFVC
jgi:hypothetical protein